MVAKCNQILQNESPAPLIVCLENMVALLRNKAGTKPVDVELFMKDHAKLVAQMNRTETTSCSLEIVNSAFAELEKVTGRFGPPDEGEIDITAFFPFMEWSLNFCKAARIDLKMYTLEKEVKAADENALRAQLAANRYENQKQDSEAFGFDAYYTDMIATMEERIETMREINETDHNQAWKVQEKYHTFERDYLAGYTAMIESGQ